ncbi:MAG TPA: uroporphyrinogen decarboxylase family protein [Verrucomicrobiota bacterium]|nr:uroporphyrinogen decarboxylase family protein [Verrucomicrobiota bacterium]
MKQTQFMGGEQDGAAQEGFHVPSGTDGCESCPELASAELIRRTLGGLHAPRVPIGPLAVHYCARLAGVSIREFSTSSRVMVDCILRYYERFRPDAVWLSADTWVSAEAMGATVGALADDQPLGGLGGPRIRRAADIDCIPPPRVESQGRYPLMLDALARLAERLGKDVFIVVCFDQYPFSLAAALMGINEIMVKVIEDRPGVEALMERCLEYGLAYGRALSEGGADMLSGGDSPAGLLGPRIYRELALPYEQRLIAGLKRTARQPISLHICGNSLPMLGSMAESGADVLEIDHQVDLAHACRMVSPQLTLWGNLDPVSLLANGTAAEIRQAALQAIAIARAYGRRRFVLSSGCTLAMETPEENLDALFRCEY